MGTNVGKIADAIEEEKEIFSNEIDINIEEKYKPVEMTIPLQPQINKHTSDSEYNLKRHLNESNTSVLKETESLNVKETSFTKREKLKQMHSDSINICSKNKFEPMKVIIPYSGPEKESLVADKHIENIEIVKETITTNVGKSADSIEEENEIFSNEIDINIEEKFKPVEMTIPLQPRMNKHTSDSEYNLKQPVNESNTSVVKETESLIVKETESLNVK